ncbi:FimV/HubP family polar landmark protein [Marinomonas algarum]|uniref:Pilus assembly protein FimV n=1 Tax=Marinomonas algarum TaxID=2883105 RepID=A0A9X1IJ09_9GAMM|nr:FimV/HubP family polar landmark protein [Marinomonas algarum]MCB5160419.1 pilus assembly protein FimV [Marinomonas algarum]
MLRKTLISIAVSGALHVTSSYALELGELTSQSKVNEAYRGKITLSDVGNLTTNDILVRLGSESEFQQAGFVPTSVISQLRFDVVRENRDLTIAIRSDRPLQVDELRFVLAARWPSGQVVREYKTPLNPSALVGKSGNEAIQAVNQGDTGSVLRNATATAQRMPISGRQNVLKGNTLWSIAGQNQPSNQLSIYQTMMAIQALNKDAFYSDNINLLKEGVVLRLPTQEQIALFNQSISKQEFDRQHAAWMASKSQKNAKTVDQAQLNTQAKAKAASNAPQEKGDTLTLASGQSLLPEDASSSNTGEDSQALEALQNKLSASQEMLDKEQREKAEISDQLEELNSQLATLEQLISLKDTQMAQLQQEFSRAQQALQEQKNTVDQLLEADQLRREKEQAEADSLVNKIFGNPVVVSIGAVVLLLLGFLLGWLMRRGSKGKQEEATTAKDEFDLAQAAVPAAAAAVATETVAADDEVSHFEEDPFAFDLDEKDDGLSDFGALEEDLAKDDLPSSIFDEEEPTDSSDSAPEEASSDEDIDDIFAAFEDSDDLPEPEIDFSEEDDLEAVDEEDIPTMSPESIEPEPEEIQEEPVEQAESEVDSVESEEESFVSSLLNDVESDEAADPAAEEDTDESELFAATPDDSLSNSIEETLAEAQQDEEDLDVPSFGESEAAAESEESDEEEEFDFFDASGDEAATKLDLARAYLDMGDEEGARVILEDVVESGNEQQVTEAQDMMERMFPSE